MNVPKRYEPIDCNVHDRLLERATLRRPTAITYRDERGETVLVTGIIVDVFSQRGEEFLQLGNGEKIRLDKIVRFEDPKG